MKWRIRDFFLQRLLAQSGLVQSGLAQRELAKRELAQRGRACHGAVWCAWAEGPLFSKRLRPVRLGRLESPRNLDDFPAPGT